MTAASVVCKGPCQRIIWEGGRIQDGQVVDLPFEDGQELLTAFADESCPVGGRVGDCPNTTDAVEERDEQRPARLRQLVKAAQARLPSSRSLFLPALVANTPQEIPVTWPNPLADATYQVTIGQEFAQPVLLGKIEAAVKAGTRTPEGCTLLVAASRDVADGQAGLHIVAIP